jgi:hypothetical protein
VIVLKSYHNRDVNAMRFTDRPDEYSRVTHFSWFVEDVSGGIAGLRKLFLEAEQKPSGKKTGKIAQRGFNSDSGLAGNQSGCRERGIRGGAPGLDVGTRCRGKGI